MKLDYRLVIIIIAALFIAEHTMFKTEPTIDDVVVVVDKKVGEVEKKIQEVVRDTIYIKVEVPGKIKPQKKQIVVDSLYKAKYEEAIERNDSLAAKNLFLESIALDEFKGTLINNKDIKIDGEFTTRGKLLEYSIDYKIKTDTIKYTPEIVYRYPRASLVYGLGLTLPTENGLNYPLVIQGVVGFQNKNGSIFTVGFNSNNTISVGYQKTFKLYK